MDNSTDPDKLASKLVQDLNCFPKRMYYHHSTWHSLSYMSFLSLTLYLIGTPFNAFASRADPDKAALVRAA